MHEEDETTGRRWLLFIYRVPQDPPGRRTYVWRQLKGLGAAYLQQAAAILPDQPDLGAALEGLAGRVQEFGGEASLLRTTSPSAAWEAETVARFNQGRDAEYAELIENVERFEDEIARESRREKFTFAELEDLEADWEKLQRWRERIGVRDFFAAPSQVAADAILARARASLEAFTATVYEREGAQEPRGDADVSPTEGASPAGHGGTHDELPG
jgi:hypothetical protein